MYNKGSMLQHERLWLSIITVVARAAENGRYCEWGATRVAAHEKGLAQGRDNWQWRQWRWWRLQRWRHKQGGSAAAAAAAAAADIATPRHAVLYRTRPEHCSSHQLQRWGNRIAEGATKHCQLALYHDVVSGEQRSKMTGAFYLF